MNTLVGVSGLCLKIYSSCRRRDYVSATMHSYKISHTDGFFVSPFSMISGGIMFVLMAIICKGYNAGMFYDIIAGALC